MRDNLLDLVAHTYDLGCIDLIKIVGTDKSTQILGLAEDRTVVIEASFHNPVAEFIGTFGMPNLGKLKILLNLPEYRENAVLSINRKSSGEPDGITFTNSAGDFRNSYRFMSSEIVTEKLKPLKFNEPKWDVEFEPAVSAIMRLKMQAQANAEETLFQTRTDKGDLKFFFGDHSTHAGDFVFHAGVSGELKKTCSWPISQVMSILGLTGNKMMKISDGIASEIRVDSGLATYRYILPAQKK